MVGFHLQQNLLWTKKQQRLSLPTSMLRTSARAASVAFGLLIFIKLRKIEQINSCTLFKTDPVLNRGEMSPQGNRIHKKGAKEECPCFLGLYLKGKKKVVGGSRKSPGNKAGESATCESKSYNLKV